MKIDGGFSLSKAETKSKLKRSTKNASVSGVDFLSHSSDLTDASSASASSSAQKIDVILTIQEIDNEMERNKKSTYKSNQLLDGLEHLRLELLSGSLSSEKLFKLRDVLEIQMIQPKDQRLASIQKQIEQRVRIELAKHDI